MAMMTPDQESIDTFINITGSSKLVAIHKLMEHGGGLNEAVNSYFAERDTNKHETFVAVPHDDFMSIDETHRGCRKSHPSVSPSAPRSSTLPDYGIEEKKIQAATDASKRKSETGQPDVPTEQEKVLGELESEAGPSEIRTSKSAEVEEVSTLATSNERLGVGSLAALEEAKEYPVRRRSPRTNLGSPSSPALQQNVNNSDEWGGISSEEHNEAVMLEAAMFCGLSEGGARDRVRYNTRNRYTRNRPGRFNGPYARPVPLSPSPTLIAQRLIREQQNDEYLESLKADREKEAAREAAMKEEERKLEQQQETERQIAAKEASLPQEPACDDENAVTLLVRMPDGSRRSRRFMKTDKLQYLFDFVDVGRAVKPSTYRLVRPYPRRAFSDDDSHLTLNDLGLTSKQEALFLEFI